MTSGNFAFDRGSWQKGTKRKKTTSGGQEKNNEMQDGKNYKEQLGKALGAACPLKEKTKPAEPAWITRLDNGEQKKRYRN